MEPLLSNLLNEADPQATHLPQPCPQPSFDSPQASPRSQHAPQTSQNLPNTTPNSLKYLFEGQLIAYKHLIRNLPLPASLSLSLPPSLLPQTHEKLVQTAIHNAKTRADKDLELKTMICAPSKSAGKEESSQAEQLKLAIDKRKNELEHTIERSDELNHTPKELLILQHRFLSCRELYKNVFQRIGEGMRRNYKSVSMFSQGLLDRSFFRRERAGRGQINGKGERSHNLKTDNDRRKRIMHKQCMQHLKLHKEEFLEWHRKKIKDRRRIANLVKNTIETRKREKEQLQERKKIARLKELKAQNMEIYLSLVEQEKKTKIKELLSQTNKFLKELGAKVLVQKGGKEQNAPEAAQAEQEGLQQIFQSSNTVYYNLTHSIKEEVTVQPTILKGGDLKNYQLLGLQWLVSLYNNNLNGILADQMGLGKTIQTISLLCYLIEYKKNFGPFLVVAPLSTIPNWMAQFQKWAPSIRKIVYKGNPNTRTQTRRIMKNTKWNVCITTYDFILKDRLKLNKYDWKYIVIDQGHKMKNAKSKFSNILGQQYQSDHRLLLTGTPLQNNLGQLWALLNFLLPKVFNSCDDFQKWFSMALYKNTGDQAVQLDEQEQLLIINRLHQVLRPFLLRRVKKDVYSQLPDKKEHVIKVQLSAWQKLIYDNISAKTVLQFSNSSNKVSRTTLNNLMMQLRKCCNHPYLFLKNYDDISYHEWIMKSSGKFELIDRILPKLLKFKHRILIFTQMTHLMDIMQIYFEYRGIRHLRLDGSTKAEDREERMRLFNEPNSVFDIFLLSTRAGGLGLNLQTADTVIIFDSDWNPQMDLQAQDRVHRIGQQKEVIVLRLITNNSIQEHILQRTAFKMSLNQLFIQGGLYNLNSSDTQRRKKIQEILLKTRKDVEQNEQQQIIDDDMINQFLKRNDEQYEEFTKMDEERYSYDGLQEGKEGRRNYNYRLMKYEQIPSWFKQTPKVLQQVKEYGRGNRIRKQINYHDEVIDEKVLNIDDFEDEEQNIHEMSDLSVSKSKREHRPPRQNNQNYMDVQQLFMDQKPQAPQQAFFEDED